MASPSHDISELSLEPGTQPLVYSALGDRDPPLLTGATQFKPRSDVQSILISGGAGFIGSWVTRHLALTYKDSYKVVCFDALDTVASIKNIAGLGSNSNFCFVKGDIRCAEDVKAALETYQIDCVLHFAAFSHVQDSFGDPMGFYENNVKGTLVVLEAIRAYGKIQRFIHVSTDEVYGQTEGAVADESHNLTPTNPYSASKAAAEMLVTAYQKSFGIPAIIVRSNNVYGPHQYPQREIIPLFIGRVMLGQKLQIQGHGHHSRRYLYGADAADAFDTILHKGCVGSCYNIASADEVTNIDVALRILDSFGHDPKNRLEDYVEWIGDRPFNDSDYHVCDDKLKDLGWIQRTAFDVGLARTVQWYRVYSRNWWEAQSSLTIVT